MVEVVNRQRGRKIATAEWSVRATEMLAAIGKEKSSATVAFVSDAKIRELNRAFRGIDKPTDVLSFPADEDVPESNGELGDIAISVDRAAAQAKENELTLNEEIAQLILHGLLHLCGYDHETDNGEMNHLELKLRKKLAI